MCSNVPPVAVLVAAYTAGESLTALSRRHRVSPLVIRRRLVDAGIEIRDRAAAAALRGQRRHRSGREDVAERITANIAAGMLPAGSSLPSYRSMADTYEVSPATVARAVALLRERDLVQGAHGRRPYVAGGGPEHRLEGAQAIADDLMAQIRRGEYPAGSRLPSLRQLVIRYGVAMSTAQRVHRQLMRQGLARGEQGRGVFLVERAANAGGRTPRYAD